MSAALYDPHAPPLQQRLYAVYRTLRDDHPLHPLTLAPPEAA